MAELSKEFRSKFLADMANAIAHPGQSFALQEGGPQFPGSPQIWIKFMEGPPDYREGGITVWFSKDKTPGEWTDEAKIPMSEFIRQGNADGTNGGVISNLLRDTVPDDIVPHNRHSASHGFCTGHFAINAHRNDVAETSHLHFSFHKDDAAKIAARINELREQIAAGEGHADTIKLTRNEGKADGVTSTPTSRGAA